MTRRGKTQPCGSYAGRMVYAAIAGVAVSEFLLEAGITGGAAGPLPAGTGSRVPRRNPAARGLWLVGGRRTGTRRECRALARRARLSRRLGAVALARPAEAGALLPR